MGWWDGIATFYEATIHKNYEIGRAIECLEKEIFFTRCDHLKFFSQNLRERTKMYSKSNRRFCLLFGRIVMTRHELSKCSYASVREKITEEALLPRESLK